MDFKYFTTGLTGKNLNQYASDVFLDYIKKLAEENTDKIDLMLEVVTMQHWEVDLYIDLPYDSTGDLMIRNIADKIKSFIGDLNTIHEDYLSLIVDNYNNNKRIETIVTPWGFWISLND